MSQVKPISVEIGGQTVEAMPFGTDLLIKGTEQDRLTIVWDGHPDRVGHSNGWGSEDTIQEGNEAFQDDYEYILEALDYFWPGWAERAP